MNQLTRVEPSALGILNRSEIDGQIAIARQYPRSLELFEDRAMALATHDAEIAAECLYALPRDGKTIEGPSVRLAEILVANWGNCRVGARIIEEGEEHVTAQGIFHDLETNAVTTFETRRRIIDKRGKRYSPDMVNTTCNAACAIALRQATLKAIPKTYWEPVYKAARARAVGAAEDLSRVRQAALKGFAGYGVGEERILKALGVASLDEIGADEIAKLRGIYQAMRDGEISADEAFPVEKAQAQASEAITTLEEFARTPTEKRDASKPMSVSASPTPIEESAADAYGMGMEARRKGGKKTQFPARFKDAPDKIEAWVAGWQAKDEEIRADTGRKP